LHQVPQPWHPQGTYVHEAALAVRSVDEAKYEDYVTAVFTAYDGGKFKDDDTWNKTRQQVYDELLDMAKAVGVDRDAVKAKLAIKPEGGNCGNEMTQTIKWIVKHHRLRAVHVTPTVFVNGLEAGIVSSGWTSEQWLQFLEPGGEDCWQGAKM